MEQLEEESTEERDYYNQATLELFEPGNADADLLALLRQTLGTREGIEIAWSQNT
jgi:hypothetical protein